MRIVSVNAWGGARYDDLVAWLPTTGADVVCLQEVTRTPGMEGWTRFEDDARILPQRADLMSDVRTVLPAYDGWFTVSDSGPVTDEEHRVHRQHFGIGMFAGPALVQVGARAAYVHGSYADHGDTWPHSGRPRAAQVARFADGGRFVTLGHLHGLRDDGGKGDTPARRAQAQRLVELVEGVREPGDLVVVCGDLNLLPDSETFAILAAVGLTDLVGTADTRTSSYPKPVRHASYLLVSEPDAVRSFEVVAEPEVSDHRALLVEI
ncbi:endonuclease/exonuclease/phosphatase family protein [Nocardioides sp. L-11A]|uniref:endonuclease/exonuclease/phosphatase family protein n=1 Tax=Nocardioides sp. L-11A TaxID=3043848 RepID=UPI00249AFA97|nr:endonuclease/exonuclease/phosphatase family protein [Nocardioides sp. L-11A]